MPFRISNKSNREFIDGGEFTVDTRYVTKGFFGQRYLTNVDICSKGADIQIDMRINEYRAARYTYYFHIADNAPIRFSIFNSTLTPLMTSIVYNPQDKLTTLETTGGLLGLARFTYIFTGNPFNLRNYDTRVMMIVNNDRLDLNSKHSSPGETEVCYLAGTRILTPSGERTVESLRAGDAVETWNATCGMKETLFIRWVGKGRAVPCEEEVNDQSGHPVCIRKNALSDGVPHSDLYVTSEHCLFVRGAFVPARMLVNGTSIYFVRDSGPYDYFHIETENHSIIWANGLTAESYLDTGNRKTLTQVGPGVRSVNTRRSWDCVAAAMLCTHRDFVEPLFIALRQRAQQIGHGRYSPPAVTHDDKIALRTREGQIIAPCRRSGNRAVFVLPDGVSEIWITSQAARPSESIGPFVDDRRKLGVLIGAIDYFGCSKSRSITSHLAEHNLPGWEPVDPSAPFRWTNGFAYLDLSEAGPDIEGEAVISVEIISAGPYLEQPKPCDAPIEVRLCG